MLSFTGLSYLRDWINLADFAIIVISMFMTVRRCGIAP